MKVTRCCSVDQEAQSALLAVVVNVHEESYDDEANTGCPHNIAKELDELRAAKQWINQEGWAVAAEGRACSEAANRNLEPRLDWNDVRRMFVPGTG